MNIEDIPRKQEVTKRVLCFADESSPSKLRVCLANQDFASAMETSTLLFDLDLSDTTECAKTLQHVLPLFRDAGYNQAQQDFRDFLKLDEIYQQRDD